MKNIVSITGLIIFLFNSTTVHAQVASNEAAINDPYYQISEVKSEVISVEEKLVSPEEINNELLNESFTSSPISLPQEGVDPMAIADIFFKIWDIIKDGAPVVNAEYKNVCALPNISNSKWETLTGWKSERTITYGVSTQNLLGMTTVDLEYKVRLLSGGGYKGKGQYIASARVVPTKVDVMWGYNLDVGVQVPSVLNLASQADPLAAINLDVTYKISTVMRSYSESQNYELRGDGQMKSNGKVVYAASSR